MNAPEGPAGERPLREIAVEARGASAFDRVAFDRVVMITGAGSGIGAALARQIAALIAFLLSDAARHITGQVIHVDGGLTLG